MPWSNEPFDIVIVGGGINGVSIARDAAGRGLRVLLCEKGDLASGTSSASSKLIHGGLRYLEHYAFGLVRESLKEREVILRAAPHIVSPLQFILPHMPGIRSTWMVRLGLFLYDHLGARELLPASGAVDLISHEAGAILQHQFVKGFTYSDCWVKDARLVILNAMDAERLGAIICPRTACKSATREEGYWDIELVNEEGQSQHIQAQVLVNATGPWANQFLEETLHTRKEPNFRLVKGSHIIVPRLHTHNSAYMLQNTDKRVIFMLPFEEDFTLIGTTDVEYLGKPEDAVITDAEIQYLCDAVNRYLARPVTPSDVVASYAGVRPLYEKSKKAAAKASRDYSLEWKDFKGTAPLLNVWGGKLTTYRRLGQEATNKIASYLHCQAPDWTHKTPLPGGNIPHGNVAAYAESIRETYPWLPEALARRYVSHYGTFCHKILQEASSLRGLGRDISEGFHLYEAEIAYLKKYEWAKTAEDILKRRTWLGVRVPKSTYQLLEDYLKR
ncbi:MAG: glpD [Rickettsiales bacterium]|jgi:glycerol-3-phosphate dehydrogenase|nr:glpD [Rickettsiales bacterium]